MKVIRVLSGEGIMCVNTWYKIGKDECDIPNG